MVGDSRARLPDRADQALILGPAAEFGEDGLANDDEFAAAPLASGAPSIDDADGDGLLDSLDPCPMEYGYAYLRTDYLVMDTDGDGYDDSIDNCMNESNTMQRDANADGIGDACVRYAVDAPPARNVHLFTCTGGNAQCTIHFSSVPNELRSGNPMTYLWDFEGAAPNSNEASPGEVAFKGVGDYTIEFTATD